MLVELFEIGALLAVLVVPFFFPYKKRPKSIRIPKDYNDTSEARYAINEKGFLEEIQQKSIKSHAD